MLSIIRTGGCMVNLYQSGSGLVLVFGICLNDTHSLIWRGFFLLPRVPLLNAGSSKGRSDIWSVHALFDFLFISTPEPALLLNEDREIWSKTSVVSKQSYELRLIMRKYLWSQYSVQFFLTLLVLKYFNGNLLLLSWVVIILQQCLHDLCFCCFCLHFTGRITLLRPICVDWYVLLRRFRLCNV